MRSRPITHIYSIPQCIITWYNCFAWLLLTGLFIIEQMLPTPQCIIGIIVSCLSFSLSVLRTWPFRLCNIASGYRISCYISCIVHYTHVYANAHNVTLEGVFSQMVMRKHIEWQSNKPLCTWCIRSHNAISIVLRKLSLLWYVTYSVHK